MYPASTTKIMTALLALELGDLDELVAVGEEARPASPDESVAGLTVGSSMSLRDLLSGLMLPSGNDAARVIAKHIAEKAEGGPAKDWNAAFAALMNAKAERLGARDTHFANPHGLHDPEHYSTAYDLAVIAREAMRHPSFREIVASGSYVTEAGDAWFGNRNKLLDEGGEEYFRGANGVKTGYTSAAGYCLVASAEREGRELISVVLRSTEEALYSDTRRLLTYGFS
jgi:D-alanyl-D-alanine carboxypeptidase